MFSDAITKAYADSKYGRKILVSSTPISVNTSGAAKTGYNKRFDLNIDEDIDLNEPDEIGFEIKFTSDFNITIGANGYSRIYTVGIVDEKASSEISLIAGHATDDGLGVLAVNGKRIFRTIQFVLCNTLQSNNVELSEYYLDWNMYNSLYTSTVYFNSNKITNNSKIKVFLETVSNGTYTFNADFTVNIYKLYY